jgi:hypothetical protein
MFLSCCAGQPKNDAMPSHTILRRVNYRGFRRVRHGYFVAVVIGLITSSNLMAQVEMNKDQTTTRKSARANQETPVATKTEGSTAVEPQIVVRGDELPSAYGAPGAFSRSRFSSLTNAYVLPPGGVFAGLIYEGDYFSEGLSDNSLTQEVEIGLPYRFGVAFENQVELAGGDASNRSFSIEARYALADWDKIPLNPTLFAEYKIGTGKILRDEGPPEEDMMDEGDQGRALRALRRAEEDMGGEGDMMDEGGKPDQPDAYEFRLLLSEEIAKNVEWAFNAFLENETSGDRGREWGFAQTVQVPILLPHERLKAGVEMQYTNFTVKDTRGDPIHRFVIGPSFSYKPTARMRFDLAPLFGATDDSPDVQLFAVFSYVFGGGGGEMGAEAPASTRNR